MRATLDHLQKVSIEHGTVTIGELEFEIRPLTRKQQLLVGEARERDLAYADALLLSFGMVDPSLTVEEVIELQERPGQGGLCAALSEGIGRISGLMIDSGKEAYKSAGGRSRP